MKSLLIIANHKFGALNHLKNPINFQIWFHSLYEWGHDQHLANFQCCYHEPYGNHCWMVKGVIIYYVDDLKSSWPSLIFSLLDCEKESLIDFCALPQLYWYKLVIFSWLLLRYNFSFKANSIFLSLNLKSLTKK